jgi:5-methyltetrahydrofolate--homocysteine methyltransferase
MTSPVDPLETLTQAMINLDVDVVKTQVQDMVTQGIASQDIITSLGKGMQVVGERFASGEYFLSELIWAGQIMKEAMEIISPTLTATDRVSQGKIVFATVEGDLHDIGKNIAISMLQSAGFEVIDLGVDVPAARIVETAKAEEADIIALSALLSFVEPYVIKTVQAIRDSEIGGTVLILLGGRILDKSKAEEFGADAFARDAWEGVAQATALMQRRAQR